MLSTAIIRWVLFSLIITLCHAHTLAQFSLGSRMSSFDSPIEEVAPKPRLNRTSVQTVKGTAISVSREWVRAWNADDRSTLMQLTASEAILGWAIDGLVDEPRNLPEIRQSPAYKRRFGFAGDTVVSQLKQIYEPIKHGDVIAGESKFVDENARAIDLYLESAPDGSFGMLIVQRIKGQWLVTDLRVPCECLSLVQLVQYEIIASLPHYPEFAAWMPCRESQSAEIVKIRRLRNTRQKDSFDYQWNNLEEQTKNWPWAQFLQIVILQEHEPKAVTQSLIDRFAKTGGDPNSVAWLQTRQK
ncbi:hypothetical protein [Rhodopirellula sp. SWK7]|uniref:hypothetical protein n=1 Tax=Rhodopirellula sp. SWK7 TaxID=595460 RepID=UPI0002BE6E17|nr:hypothetical protein [Rhodopirellula sp. SWK7]EMI47043.1 secreted protein [Rhodopirellula sp. SWK7]